MSETYGNADPIPFEHEANRAVIREEIRAMLEELILECDNIWDDPITRDRLRHLFVQVHSKDKS